MNLPTRVSFLFLLLAQSVPAEEIDWSRATALRQLSMKGQTLSEEDRAYLDQAIAVRTAGRMTRESDSTRGDGTGERRTVEPVTVSEELSPVQTFTATSSDGYSLEIPYRAPKAERPLPAMVFFHGGLGQLKPRELMQCPMSHPTHTRFLKEGFVSVSATFRTYGREPQSQGPILDAVAIVQQVKKLPEVDPERVILFGGSGGGSIVLELASRSEVSPLAVVAGEPATVLYTGLMTSIANREESMRDCLTLYSERHRLHTERKMAAISCPILIHHGDVHPLKKINFEIVFPGIQKAGKSMVIKKYPGQQHGFYWGNHTDEATLELVVANTVEFLAPLLGDMAPLGP
ncbi:MAG: alpha/beta hydrolase [Verrucomicrobiota bacterium]